MAADFLGIKDSNKLPKYQRTWVDTMVINNRQNKRDKKWTESIAVGEMDFVLATKVKLGAKGIGRKVIENSAGFELKEFQEPYSPVFGHEKRALSQNNGYFWDVSH